MNLSEVYGEGAALKTGLVAAIVTVSVLAASCGGENGAPGSETEGVSLRIETARWRAEPEPAAWVSGEWGLGVSTPPSCTLIEGENGEPSDWADPETRVELDGGEFYQKFVRDPDSGRSTTLDPETEYYVRCRSSGDTGRTVEATAPIKGEVPTGARG